MVACLVLQGVKGHLNQVGWGTERKHGMGIGLAEEGELRRDQSQLGERSPCPDMSGKLSRPVEVPFHPHLATKLRQKKAPGTGANNMKAVVINQLV